MINERNTSVVVVWFHPGEQQAAFIREYASAVRRVYIVDNSESDNSALAESVANTVYLPNGGNKGIATALNAGYERAIADGAEWIVSFDQDSRMSASLLTEYLRVCDACPVKDVGVYAPYPDYGNDAPDPHVIYEKRNTVITSGMLMPKETFLLTGRFRDEFFIDLVDDDYCLRVKRQGKDIVLVHTIVMKHRLGNGFVTTPFLHHRFIEHNALRHYYIVRNTMALIRDYPEQRAYYRRQLNKRIKRLLLYDWNDKGRKIRMCIRAYTDYKHGKMSQLKE